MVQKAARRPREGKEEEGNKGARLGQEGGDFNYSKQGNRIYQRNGVKYVLTGKAGRASVLAVTPGSAGPSQVRVEVRPV